MKVMYVILSSILVTLSMLFGFKPVFAADNENEPNIIIKITVWRVAQYYVNG